MSRRPRFKVFPNRVECGDWSILASEVCAATLFQARQWFIPVLILSVGTGCLASAVLLRSPTRSSSTFAFQHRGARCRLALHRLFAVEAVHSIQHVTQFGLSKAGAAQLHVAADESLA